MPQTSFVSRTIDCGTKAVERPDVAPAWQASVPECLLVAPWPHRMITPIPIPDIFGVTVSTGRTVRSRDVELTDTVRGTFTDYLRIKHTVLGSLDHVRATTIVITAFSVL